MDIKKTAREIKEHISKVLRYLRINDEKNMLSLTNITMVIIIYKISITPSTTFEAITGLAVAVLGYQGKRYVEKKK